MAARRQAGREPPLDRRAVAAVYAAYEEVKRRAGVIDFEDLLLATACGDRGAPGRRRPDPRAVPVLRRRRVPGRQPAAAAAARRLARRPRRPLRRRRRQPDDLLLHRRHARLPARLRRPLSRRRPSSGWSATTGRPRRWWRWPTRSSAKPAGERGRGCGCELVGQRPDGPGPTFASYADEPAEAAAVAAPLRAS